MTDPITFTALGAASSRSFPLGVSPARPGAGTSAGTSAEAGGPGEAVVDDAGEDTVNVAVYAPDLDDVLLYFQPPGGGWRSVLLPDFTDGVYHGVVHGMPVGSRYGFISATAATTPETADPDGLAPGGVDPDAVPLLLDPYGRAIECRKSTKAGTNGNGNAHGSGTNGNGNLYTSIRMDSSFDWDGDAHPHTPWRNTVLYEAHVKGQTMLHPQIPEGIRGSYAGLAHPAMIDYLTALGITAVELLPIHFHIDEPHLQELGLTNYWGYNTLGFFAPHAPYASAAARAAGPQAVQDELKSMVKALHAAGIEVILDVVFNHTAEGEQGRPALSWRGLAEGQYYRHDGGRYVDTTGCGNTLDFSQRRVVQLALDSLRYWVEEFHVDGFRFDLAVSLGRNADNDFRAWHPFLIAAATDRALAGIKLIAEPWDLGNDGWQTGRFPQRLGGLERPFPRFRAGSLAHRPGSHHGRRTAAAPWPRWAMRWPGPPISSPPRAAASWPRSTWSPPMTASPCGTWSPITASTTRTTGNRTGTAHSHNRSWNHGVEGPTEDEGILAARAQTSRNIMATLLLSLGVPMITAGDELGRSQLGNNNAYCQDNALAWLDWSMEQPAREMLAATKRLIRVRRDFLAHQPSSYPARGGESSYLHWFDADGRPMSPERWRDPGNRILVLLIGSPDGLLDGLVVFNASPRQVDVTLPVLADDGGGRRRFELRMSTAQDHPARRGAQVSAGMRDKIAANSINIYRS